MKRKLNKLGNSVNNFFVKKSFFRNFLRLKNAVAGGIGEEFLSRNVLPLVFPLWQIFRNGFVSYQSWFCLTVWKIEGKFYSGMFMIRWVCLCLVLCGSFACTFAGEGKRGRSFVGLVDFSEWTCEQRNGERKVVLESPPIHSAISFDELVVSWNAAPSSRLSVEVDVRVRGRWLGPYLLGHWIGGEFATGRTSIKGQKDARAKVSTDTLVLSESARELRIRIVFPSGTSGVQGLRLFGLSFVDSCAAPKVLISDRRAWGRELAVPRLCQLDFEGGKVWCSPTSVAMVQAHWAKVLSRSELEVSVPRVAAEVFDPGWEGTGNWSFNIAYAGSFPGMRSYVVRLSDVVDLEAFILAGIPVPVSVSYSALKREPLRKGDGHLVVCVGFDGNGDVIVNDPARSPSVRWVYPRIDFVKAWEHSKNTAYLIYPESTLLPPDSRGLWSIQ